MAFKLPDINRQVRLQIAATGRAPFTSETVTRMVETTKLIQKAYPVPWKLRATGIAERVKEDKNAQRIRQAAFRLRATVTKTIFGLDLDLTGLKIPGFLEKTADGSRSISLPMPAPDATVLVAGTSRNAREYMVEQVLKGEHDPLTPDTDTSGLFSDAIDSLETTAALLRIVESRVREVEEAVKYCEKAEIGIARLIYAAEARHAALLEELAEARHDVENTLALLSEETARVSEVNTRRERVLKEDVPFLVFHRGREVLHQGSDDWQASEKAPPDVLPAHDLEPVMTRSPTIDALRRPAKNAPDELREMIEVLRDAPARWFRHLAKLVPQIDRAIALANTLILSRERALRILAEPIRPPTTLKNLSGIERIGGLVKLRRAAVVETRRYAIDLQPALIARQSWKQVQVFARKILSVGDLIDSRWTSASISSAASWELEAFVRVATALYVELGQVQPRIRQAWVRILSEHDEAMDLRELARLPHWAEVGEKDGSTPADPFRRRELQSYVDWLYSRVDTSEPDALSLIHDLVRVCILLASHAPVDRIIEGALDEDITAEPGRLLPIRIDPRRIRVGMMALVLSPKGLIQARARVEDLGENRVSATITQVVDAAMLSKGARVRFVEPEEVVHATSAGTAQGIFQDFQLPSFFHS